GLLLGFAGVRFLLAINPGSIPRIGEDGSAVTVDLNVLLFTLGVSVLTGILFGLVPAISASRKSLAAVLNESSNRAGVGFRSGKVRSEERRVGKECRTRRSGSHYKKTENNSNTKVKR